MSHNLLEIKKNILHTGQISKISLKCSCSLISVISCFILASAFQTSFGPRWSSVSPIAGQEVVLQYQEQQEGGEDPWWQDGFPGIFFYFAYHNDWNDWYELKLLNFQYLKKGPSVPKCPMTGLKLKGVTPATNQEKARMSRRQKTVFRFLIVRFLFSKQLDNL